MAPYCESIDDDISPKTEIPSFTPQCTEKKLLDPEDVLVSMGSLISVVSTISDSCKLENKNGLTELENFLKDAKDNPTLMEILTNGTIYGTHFLEQESQDRIVYFAFPIGIDDDGKYIWNCIRTFECYGSEFNDDTVTVEVNSEYVEDIKARGEEVFGILVDEETPFDSVSNDSFSSGQVVKDFFAAAEVIVGLSKTPTFESAIPSAKELKENLLEEEERYNERILKKK